LIGELTRWVVSTAVRQCGEWHRAGHSTRIAVNIAARDATDADLALHLERELERWGVPPALIQLEITETQLLVDARDAQRAIGRLAGAGVSCAIDDFGTGYSSLAQLQQLDVDEIKIDRSFVLGLEDDAANDAIVRSTIGLARNLGLRVTAEGVETRAALERLIALGCDYAQGFHVGKPMPPQACRAALDRAAAESSERSRRFRPAPGAPDLPRSADGNHRPAQGPPR